MRVENFALIIAITLNLTLSSVSDAEEMAITPFDHKFLGKDTPYLKDTEWKTRIAKIEAECAPAIIQKRKINFKHDEEYERSRLDKLVFTPSDKIMSFTSSQFTDSKSCDSLAKSRALDLRKMTATLTE